jgi:hypothetical protein
LQHRGEWAARPAADGPREWQRVDVRVDESRRTGEPGSDSRKVDIVTVADSVTESTFEPVTVSDVKIGQDSVEFSVDDIGKPVLVRVSYFPNWKVDGATGPFRVAPNMMVVVPTETDVRLSFQQSATDRIAYLLTLIGILVLLTMWWRERRSRIVDERITGIDEIEQTPAL